MAKIGRACIVCGRAAKQLAKRLGKEGYCTKHARIELRKEQDGKDRME